MHGEIRRHVGDTSKLHLSREAFWLHSRYGHHRVLVFPQRGPSLHSCFASMSMASRMSAAQQALQALKSLHDANIVHRDLSDKNILCGMAPLDAYDVETKYQCLGRPKRMRLNTQTGMRADIVRPIVVPPSLLTDSVYLCDFGIAINAGTSVNYKPQRPEAWCAPERLHNMNPSAASDMWSYMCVFTELYLGTLPWLALWRMVKVLGPLPQSWFNHYHRPAGADPSWYDPMKQPESTLETMIAHARPDVSATERAHVLSFMLKGFSYDPEKRITAAQLLCDASFRAVMGLYCAEQSIRSTDLPGNLA